MTDRFRDQLSIDTPEQVSLAFPIAGLGSRVLAHLLDLLIQTGIYLALGILIALTGQRQIERLGAMSDTRQKWLLAVFLIVNFVLVWGYYALFETYWSGQTPGKRVLKLRVIKDSGRQITLFESMARNFVRVIDILPTAYVAGIISILITRENKRIGDLLAGTIVVRAEDTATEAMRMSHRTFTAALIPTPEAVQLTQFGVEFPSDAIARLSNADLVLIESFFARVPELDHPTTERIAEQMLTALCRKMGVEKPAEPSPRRCLDAIAYALRSAATYR
jgi:uncharacterized RDD family membrane protein YckC